MRNERHESLNPKAKAYLRSHIRNAWRYYSRYRKECLKGTACVKCGATKTKLFADHISPVGSFRKGDEGNYIRRMFSPLSNLQAICGTCHDAKTAEERKARSKKK